MRRARSSIVAILIFGICFFSVSNKSEAQGLSRRFRCDVMSCFYLYDYCNLTLIYNSTAQANIGSNMTLALPFVGNSLRSCRDLVMACIAGNSGVWAGFPISFGKFGWAYMRACLRTVAITNSKTITPSPNPGPPWMPVVPYHPQADASFDVALDGEEGTPEPTQDEVTSHAEELTRSSGRPTF